MELNIAVCDDSKAYGDIVKELIYKAMLNNNVNYKISTFTSGIDLVQANKENEFDIIFLDMEMPEIDGIETGLLIRKVSKNTIIIYLTSHKDYAYDSYKVKANNYLLKPISIEVLEKELLDCIKGLQEPVKALDIKDAAGIMHRIPLNEITHILRKKEDRKIHIYTLDKNEIIIAQTLENLENMLSANESFKRSSKSCLINMDNVRLINKNIIYFSNNTTEEASRRCLSLLMNSLKERNMR